MLTLRRQIGEGLVSGYRLQPMMFPDHVEQTATCDDGTPAWSASPLTSVERLLTASPTMLFLVAFPSQRYRRRLLLAKSAPSMAYAARCTSWERVVALSPMLAMA